MITHTSRDDCATLGSVGERYPENQMEFAPETPERWKEFADRREALLVDYGYNTARAYWADLQDWFEWAVERDKDVLALTEQDRTQYVALLRRRKYSENTIRRRVVVLGLLYRTVASEDEEAAALNRRQAKAADRGREE